MTNKLLHRIAQLNRHVLALILLSCVVPWNANASTQADIKRKVSATKKPKISAHAVLIVDSETGDVLMEKNSREIQPIASITKLMVAIAVLDSGVDLEEAISLEPGDERPSRGRRKSRLRVDSIVSRDELLKLMLMSSENKAAYALARSHPDGLEAFIRAMNDKAGELGMQSTRFVEPTGLSADNVSTAWDLITLLRESYRYPIIREYSTQQSHQLATGRRNLNYVNSNRLIRQGNWEIELQKTGTTQRAGKCLVMLANLGGRPVEMILLRARGKLARVRDAKLIRGLIEADQMASVTNEIEAETR